MGVAAIFSGQGAQHVGMGRECLAHSTELAGCFTQASEILGRDLRKLCLEGPIEELTQTDICQVALYTVGYGTFLALRNRGFWNDLCVCFGQSLGEWTALAAAGAISFSDGLQVVVKRAALMQAACEAEKGTMAALIGGDREKIRRLCAETDSVISNDNSPEQLIISGSIAAISTTIARSEAECNVRRAIPLHVGGAYHSPLMMPARLGFKRVVEKLKFSRPCIPVLSNVTGTCFDDLEEMRELVVLQLTEPVQWQHCVQTASEMGADKFYECGAGCALAGLVRKILSGVVAADANGEKFWQPFDSIAQR
jgi:[acyl-carrier-protein] S-malonyltransferase